MQINVNTTTKSYPIYMERGILFHAKEFIGRSGHVFLLSEDGVPEKWRNALQEQYPDAYMHVFHGGEASKNFDTLQQILAAMSDHHVSRKDTLIALGGGVTGDMGGFAASIYMRGIPYINIPTTTLSQIDSSIGGKTAIDFHGRKNNVGAFWQPDMVLVDLDTLSTLTPRHFHNGLAEAVKEGLIKDPDLFALFEKDDYMDHLEEIIEKCLRIKKAVVENDERESGERKLLNFGHTIGHAYESYHGMDGYYHGECVAMGMMSIMTNEVLKERLQKVLNRLQLPSECIYDADAVIALMKADKKADHDRITIVQVDEIGKGYLKDISMDEMERMIRK